MALRHYIPQAYLRKFLDPKNGRLAVCEKETFSRTCKPIVQICSEQDFFAINGIEEFLKNGEESKLVYKNGLYVDKDCLEDELSKLETEIGRILKKIISHASFNSINKNELIFLLQWAAWLRVATPATRNLLKEKYPDIANVHINGFIAWHAKICPVFILRTWGVMVTAKSLFTGDCPVCIRCSKPRDVVVTDLITLANYPIIFPLAPNLLLIGEPNNYRSFQVMKTIKANDELVRHVNTLMFLNSNQIIATDQAEINKFIEEFES